MENITFTKNLCDKIESNKRIVTDSTESMFENEWLAPGAFCVHSCHTEALIMPLGAGPGYSIFWKGHKYKLTKQIVEVSYILIIN